ncbi:class I SAM-dependent methyltransferase [Rhodocyclus tenuis]|uniref:2-polyprenyl-3-methyl-5-hydroxy-6-metoxy-1, 4-benzoquinol methylase n=1 Tax=Rhodocyclus tenuis TaxID=1066 RepID=A0A840GCK4_RHOTE|nr:class I SAM-dependent methyltransferase [Rhodocyclus tenuis]MBB4246312.1 2-polyprenyl-3-methyl-5-hydroxy-6-metoxy-1,4-benzoquinol methylase [Rhodocyclus tenuis]
MAPGYPDCVPPVAFLSGSYELMYEGVIRNGAYGAATAENFRVWRDGKSGTAFLDPMPSTDYLSDDYRVSVNGDGGIERYFQLHDKVALQQFALLKSVLKRGMTVADVGCGGGALLDLSAGFAAQRVAIEPYSGYHSSLAARGHSPFMSTAEALRSFGGAVDLVWSFHVIEHVPDPLAFLRDIGELLTVGGRAFILTPNVDDFLLSCLFEDYAPFWFRVAHPWYFSGKGLANVAEYAGLEVSAIGYHQEFSLSNSLHWLRDRRPQGDILMPGVVGAMDELWRLGLEQSGAASAVSVLLTKLR